MDTEKQGRGRGARSGARGIGRADNAEPNTRHILDKIDVPIIDIGEVHFSINGDDETVTDSYIKVEKREIFSGNKPCEGGIYDPCMGSTCKDWNCTSCRSNTNCAGHPGHYELKVPVPAPMFVKDLISWLKIICPNCKKVASGFTAGKIPQDRVFSAALAAVKSGSVCVHCGHVQQKVTDSPKNYTTILIEKTTDEKATPGSNGDTKTLYPHTYKNIVSAISDETVVSLGRSLKSHPKKLANKVMKMPPNSIRPDVKHPGTGKTSCNDLNAQIQSIVSTNMDIQAEPPHELFITSRDIDTVLYELKSSGKNSDAEVLRKSIEGYRDKIETLAMLYYSFVKGAAPTNGGSPTAKVSVHSKGNKQFLSLVRRWGKKQGRIRGNLMGKRTNWCSRSFITCDPTLRIDEIGLPLYMAMTQTFEEVVADYNYEKLAQYCTNGPNKYPGATHIVSAKTGARYIINPEKPRKLETGDKVYRHLIDGDLTDFNRAPSLLPSNISTMYIRVMMKGLTIRMNVLSCGFFNADFDGDAMNTVHLRTHQTAHEGATLSSPAQFFISYKDAKPAMGQVHDSVIGCYELTRSNTKMDRFHAMKCLTAAGVMGTISQKLEFTGREVVSELLKYNELNINYERTASIYQESHAPFRTYDPTEINVKIVNGDLQTGVLDKNSIGAEVNGSIFHIIHNQYGARAALNMCVKLQWIALAFLQLRGCSVHIGEMYLSEHALEKVRQKEKGLIAESEKITRQLNQQLIIPPLGKTVSEYYEELQMNALKASDKYWKYILSSIDPDNNMLFKLITTGARGKLPNFKNIICAIGQLDINGERMKENFNGRGLAYFTRADSNPAARGFIGDSYYTGLSPAAGFYHAMESRYQLIARSLMTSVTGYQNRMSAKSLETIITDNMRHVVSNGRILQPVYNICGSDTRFVETVKMPIGDPNYTNDSFSEKYDASRIATRDTKTTKYAIGLKDPETIKLLKDEFVFLKAIREDFIDSKLNLQYGSELIYDININTPFNIDRILYDSKHRIKYGSPELKRPELVVRRKLSPRNQGFLSPTNLSVKNAIHKVSVLCDELPYCLMNENQRRKGVACNYTNIPIQFKEAVLNLTMYIRSTMCIAMLIKDEITDSMLDLAIQQIISTYKRSLVSAGKPIGIIAAQSISEPMTQQVLDSHHNSGGDSTKKKGMFRVKELLGAKDTKSMQSPTMSVYLLPEYAADKNMVRSIANQIEQLPLSGFVKRWMIFFDSPYKPANNAFPAEKDVLSRLAKYSRTPVPQDLTNWCIRFGLDKQRMQEKQMEMETVVNSLRKSYPNTYLAFSDDNEKELYLRVYFKPGKQSPNTKEQCGKFALEMLGKIVRGIPGITGAYPVERPYINRQSDGSLKKEKINYILTQGTNLSAMLELECVDSNMTQSDSVIETYEVFGLEAARKKFINEFKIQVGGSSHNHYDLYAHMMSAGGTMTSIDRHGSARRGANELLRISDADPVLVMTRCAINASTAKADGVSPALMVGKSFRIGTLYNTLMMNEKFIDENSTYRDAEDLLNALM